MIIYFAGVHRDFGKAVEDVAMGRHGASIGILTAYDYFHKKKHIDRGLRKILKYRRKRKGVVDASSDKER